MLFLFSNFMYMSCLLACCIGGPWRKPVYTNAAFMMIFLLILCYSVLLVVVPSTRLEDLSISHMNSRPLNSFILAMGLCVGLLIYLVSKLVVKPLAEKCE